MKGSIDECVVPRPLPVGFRGLQPKREMFVPPPMGPATTEGAIGFQCYVDQRQMSWRSDHQLLKLAIGIGLPL